jgi:magnesium transporter
LIDAGVDHGFPVLERYGEVLEQIEDAIVASPDPTLLPHLHALKRELGSLRRVFWPTRELVAQLSREGEALVSDVTRTYLRDVYDHCVQILDIVESFRETAAALTDLHMSVTSNRTNEVMRVLTVMATLFIPATFLAGVYGMNFEHMPELGWGLAYPAFWAACLAMFGGLLFYFRRRGWLG